MKKIFLGCLILITTLSFAQEDKIYYYDDHSNVKKEAKPIGKFGFYLDIPGVFQYGPIFSAEIKVRPRMVFKAHYRLSAMSMIRQNNLVRTSLPLELTISSRTFGLGLIHFFGQSKSKFYFGVVVEKEDTYVRYTTSITTGGNFGSGLLMDRRWKEKTLSLVLITANTGYRFRFNSGIFINTGVYAGFATGSRKTSEYPINKSETVDIFTPHIMLDFGIGYEFQRKD